MKTELQILTHTTFKKKKKKRMSHVLVTSDLRVGWIRAETVKFTLKTHRIVDLTQNNMLQVEQTTVSKERRGRAIEEGSPHTTLTSSQAHVSGHTPTALPSDVGSDRKGVSGMVCSLVN